MTHGSTYMFNAPSKVFQVDCPFGSQPSTLPIFKIGSEQHASVVWEENLEKANADERSVRFTVKEERLGVYKEPRIPMNCGPPDMSFLKKRVQMKGGKSKAARQQGHDQEQVCMHAEWYKRHERIGSCCNATSWDGRGRRTVDEVLLFLYLFSLVSREMHVENTTDCLHRKMCSAKEQRTKVKRRSDSNAA